MLITLDKLNKLVTEVQKSLLTSKDFISPIACPFYSNQEQGNVPEILKSFKRRLDILRRNASKQVNKINSLNFPSSYPGPNDLSLGSFYHSIVVSLVMINLGLADSHECSTALAIKLAKNNYEHLVFVDILFTYAKLGMNAKHTLIIANLTEKPAQRSKESVIEFFKRLPNSALVADVFLGCCFAPTDIPDLFLRYIAAYGDKTEISQCVPFLHLTERFFNPYINLAKQITSHIRNAFPEQEKTFGSELFPLIFKWRKTQTKPTAIPVLLKSNSPAYIWYADKPPLLGGIPRKLTIAEFETLIPNFTYSEHIHADFKPNLKLNFFQVPSVLTDKARFRLHNPLNDKLVVCYINEQVGYGLFARQDIERREVIALYSGVLTSNKTAKITDQHNDYSYNIGYEDKENNPYEMEANSHGGLARFMQHLPYNPTFIADDWVAYFKQANEDEIITHLREQPDAGTATEYELSLSAKALKYDVLQGGEVHTRNMVAHQTNETGKTWELESLDKKTLSMENIAWSNVYSFPSVINGIPVSCLYAERNIQAGEQIGFSYSCGYWCKKNRLPWLFSRQGMSIPPEHCGYQRIPVATSIKSFQRILFFTKEQYLQRQHSALPVQLVPNLSIPVSFFSLRRTMASQGVLNKNYSPLSSNSFVNDLKRWLPSDISIELFNRYPDAKEDKQRWLVDVVISCPDELRWKLLTVFFRGSQIAKNCKCFQYTLEILIRGVNNSSDNFFTFTKNTLDYSPLPKLIKNIPNI